MDPARCKDSQQPCSRRAAKTSLAEERSEHFLPVSFRALEMVVPGLSCSCAASRGVRSVRNIHRRAMFAYAPKGRTEVSAPPAASQHTRPIARGASTERKQPRREITSGVRGFLIGEGTSASVSAAFILLFCAPGLLHTPSAILLLSDLLSENHSVQAFWQEQLLATAADLPPLLTQISAVPEGLESCAGSWSFRTGVFQEDVASKLTR